MPLTDAQKKRAQREREKAFGTVNVNVKLSAKQNGELLNTCKIRGGVRGPYDKNEYIVTLIRKDAERLVEQLKQIGQCVRCYEDLPNGCGGKNMKSDDCYHNLGHRELML